nr:hypothetical protein [Tanacetum cinerariifolium]GFA98766.1 hypothetical protein [Tanacetum cinerariifolium]
MIQPTTSKPHNKKKHRKPKRQDLEETQPSGPTTNVADEALNEENVPTHSNDPPLLRVNTLGSGEDILKLNELIELCTKLCNDEEIFAKSVDVTEQAKEIVADKDLIDDITLAKSLMEIKVIAVGTRPKAKSIVIFDEQEARRLQAEIDEQDRLAEEKA